MHLLLLSHQLGMPFLFLLISPGESQPPYVRGGIPLSTPQVSVYSSSTVMALLYGNYTLDVSLR